MERLQRSGPLVHGMPPTLSSSSSPSLVTSSAPGELRRTPVDPYTLMEWHLDLERGELEESELMFLEGL